MSKHEVEAGSSSGASEIPVMARMARDASH
jgi:hypothetical protein